MNRLAAAIAGAAVALGLAGSAGAEDLPGKFDFYVLALSWMPSFCADQSRSSDSCRTRPGAGFLLHGLWPQNEHGYPEYCAGRRPPRIAGSIGDSMTDIMPDRGLVFAEWRKHGACSGLDPARYFALAREAFRRIAMPEVLQHPVAEAKLSGRAIEAAFVSANPGLSSDSIAVSCAEGRLREVRICMGRDLAFRPCPEVDRRGCRRGDLSVPAPH